MAQKPIAMEHLKQVLQLHKDGIAIREIARRVGIDRNTVRKYLSRLKTEDSLSEGGLAEQAYDIDLLELEAERLRQVTIHLASAEKELAIRYWCTTEICPPVKSKLCQKLHIISNLIR